MGKDNIQVRLLNIQGNNLINNIECSIRLKKEPNYNIRHDGNIMFDLFNCSLDDCLELSDLKSVYNSLPNSDKKFIIKYADECYSTALINVSIDNTYNEYNLIKSGFGYVYVRAGYEVSLDQLRDHKIVDKKGTLIAIEIPFNMEQLKGYKPVRTSLSVEILEPYFEFDSINKCYIRKKENNKQVPFKKINDLARIRERLYTEGFIVDGKKYVRYKRSAGSSREGHCLFILESMYDKMMEISSCGIDTTKITDIASWESYIALTLSNMEKAIKIPLASILFVRDVKSTFKDKVIAIESVDNSKYVTAQEKEAEITNNIFDGESLLDKSVFDENGYTNKGMMLLRNKFFKTCAFNTNIQQYFEDNNITKIKQLNGYTKARQVSDIKMIVTESSIKYLKFTNYNKDKTDKAFKEAVFNWLKNIKPEFGVVKTDKPTHYMGGDMVQTSYQLLNTLCFTDEEVGELLRPSIEYLENIRREPIYMRYYIKDFVNDKYLDEYDVDFEDVDQNDKDMDENHVGEKFSLINHRYKIIRDLLLQSNDFARTQLYKDFRSDITKSFKTKLKLGKILIDGTYATLFGNGAELLKYSIGDDTILECPELLENQIYCKKFKEEELLCSRSPHITMGNLLIGENIKNDFYDRYFNLSDEIVAVNAINFNIQNRLNGCDYDSDTMLITTNKTMLNSAKKYYDKFLVPTCFLEAETKTQSLNAQTLSKLDINTFNNYIGEIVNLSQYLNSILWDKIYENVSAEDINSIYLDICKLAVLSGVEIDKAKKNFNISPKANFSTILELKNKYKEIYGIPDFYNYITKLKNQYSSNIMAPLKNIHTAMEQIYHFIKPTNMDSGYEHFNCKLIELIDSNHIEKGNNDYMYKKECLLLTDKYSKEVARQNQKLREHKYIDKINILEEKQKILQEYFYKMQQKIKNEHVVKLLIDVLDSKIKYIDRSLLLSALCMDRKKTFNRMVIDKQENNILELEKTSSNLYSDTIYGTHFTRKSSEWKIFKYQFNKHL